MSSILGLNPALLLPSAILGYLGSIINVAYLMNVGSSYNTLRTKDQALLVHETAHVWQGKNSTLALTYVFSSALNQCVHGARAYSYAVGQPWKSYNAEQQASLVEDWFAQGQPKTGALYHTLSIMFKRETAKWSPFMSTTSCDDLAFSEQLL